jgi:hypothetical protein
VKEQTATQEIRGKNLTKTKQMKEYTALREIKSSTTLQVSTTSGAEWEEIRAKYKKGTNME